MPKATQAIDQRSLEWMPKTVWGPIKWRELHVRGLIDLPMQDEALWFHAFLIGVPCPKCQSHFEKVVRTSPPDFSSRTAFFIWSVFAHNEVNQKLGKKSLPLDAAFKRHQFQQAP